MNERRPFRGQHDRQNNRDFRRPFRSRTENSDDLYDGVCSKCGFSFKVPFKPDPARPLLCKRCLHESRENDEMRPAGDAEHKGFEIVCSHCGKHDTVPFHPYEGSAVLCRECMNNPNIERVRGKVLHTIICANCGRENKVPFKPDPGSRVLCRECHLAERAKKQAAIERFAQKHPSIVNNTKVRIEIRCEKCGAVDVLPFMPKTHGAILCRQCAEKTFGDDWAKRNCVASREYPFTCARCAAQDFLPFKPEEGADYLCKHCLNNEAILTHSRDEMQRHDAFSCVRRRNHDGEKKDN